MNQLKKLSTALAATVLAFPTMAQEIDAAAFIHEYSDRAILEASCTRKGSQSTALVRLTQQFGGYVNYVSVVVTAPGQMRSPLIEREIPVDQPARAGHIFLGRPSSATFIGAFWGLSATGNPIRYSIPDGTTVTCD